ncbi:C-type lectin domain family 2 member E-like [Alligator mississippiensis]|uniref:C-type lectin domain family 2 member E-like n=1 Tax=Alligator mississippiensis TaxID=8496 RepID=A0A151MZG2_ALLMI|nr:C-type lectin domain family 2 member E-like [Alligator mississippiensis]
MMTSVSEKGGEWRAEETSNGEPMEEGGWIVVGRKRKQEDRLREEKEVEKAERAAAVGKKEERKERQDQREDTYRERRLEEEEGDEEEEEGPLWGEKDPRSLLTSLRQDAAPAVEKKRENGSCAKAEPTYFQEDSQKGKGQTHVTIPLQGGERSTKSPQGCLATVSPWMYRLLILSVALNLCLAIPLLAHLAKRPEQHPAAPAIPVLSCPADWIGYLGRCYYFSEAKGSWDSSQSSCSSLGASLARIDNEKEMRKLLGYVQTCQITSHQHWTAALVPPDGRGVGSSLLCSLLCAPVVGPCPHGAQWCFSQ